MRRVDIAECKKVAVLTWPYGHDYIAFMRTIAAGRFKDVCLKMLDEVAATRTPVVITKRGKPVAQLAPYLAPDNVQSLTGSILRETGDPYGTGEQWDADRDASGS
ncbi:MAG: type II toxin-antitoxin system Phd/YefM family antitoxin [Acidobacteria bacterium]|nr:type II toxin-antitoxin system Phd/YefM family antitoxin [Acidobacteriota bacterium]